jgi:hypothetical protein
MGRFVAVRRQVAPMPGIREVQVPRSRTLAGYELAPSRFGPGAGTSRDDRQRSTVLEPNRLLARCESLGLRQMGVNFGEEKNPPKAHDTP